MKRFLKWLTALTVIASAHTGIAQTVEEAVIVHFSYGSKDLTQIFVLEDKLEKVISDANVGEYDGNEIATDGSDGYLYMYGPDADKLFETIRPVLESARFMRGAEIRKRYGPPKEGVRESVIKFAP